MCARFWFMALLVSFLLWGWGEEEGGLVLWTIEGDKALDVAVDGRGHVLVVGYTDDLLEERSEGFSDTVRKYAPWTQKRGSG
ncbi:MAG: hypothetical protein ACUVUP_01770 [Thermaceae bacterium]